MEDAASRINRNRENAIREREVSEEGCSGTKPLDRECSRKPRLAGGAKGHNIIKQFLTGELGPVGGELHFL